MNSCLPTRTISEVADALAHQGTCSLLLGAGISISAGIPSAGGVIQDVCRLYLGAEGVGDDDFEKWLFEPQPFLDPEAPYASVLDAALPSRESRAAYFEQLLAGRKPSEGHLAIADLMHAGHVSVSATTNFDRLLESAIVTVTGRVPCVLAADRKAHRLDLESPRPTLLKLHGDYLYGNIRNLKHELEVVRASMAEKLRLAGQQPMLIVAGYSGADASVMEELLNLASDSSMFTGGVFWLALPEAQLNARVINFLNLTSKRGSGVVRCGGSDKFFSWLRDRKAVNIGKRQLGRLGSVADTSVVGETERDAFLTDCLEPIRAREFSGLLARREDLSSFARTHWGLDCLVAAFEAEGDLPRNFGRLLDEFVDVLATADGGKPPPGSRYERRLAQLAQLGFVDSSGNAEEESDFGLAAYLKALRICGDERPIFKTLESGRLASTDWEALKCYVGLVEDATPLIKSVANTFAGPPGLHGRARPWPELFLRSMTLLAAAEYVDPGLVALFADLLLLEFDSERWPPSNAIRALACLGPRAIRPCVEYLADAAQDTFSLEDAAQVLGSIGTWEAVDALEFAANSASSREAKFIVYALGLTNNPRALAVVKRFAAKVSMASQHVVTEALRRLGYASSDVFALNRTEEPSSPSRPDRRELIEGMTADDDGGRLGAFLQERFRSDPGPTLLAMKESGWPPDMRRLLHTARSFRESGHLLQAEELASECVERYPMVAHAYHDLALVYSRQNRLTAARRYYSIGLTLSPDYSNYFNDFSVIMNRLGNTEAARYLLMKAIALDENNYRPWMNLAGLNLSSGEANLGNAGTMPMPGGGRVMLGYTSGVGAHLYEAQICLLQVLHLNSEHPIAIKMLEEVSEVIGKPRNQRPTASQLGLALRLGVSEPGGMIDPSGFGDETVAAMRTFSKLIHEGELDAALAAIQVASTQAPRSVDIAHNLSLLLTHLNRIREAIAVQEQALQHDPWNRELLLNYSSNLRSSGQPGAAKNAAERALRADPRSVTSWVALAQAEAAANRLPQAQDALTMAIMNSHPWSLALIQPGTLNLFKSLGMIDDLRW